MKKISPQGVTDDFILGLEEIKNFHGAGIDAFDSAANQSTLTEHSLLAVAVLWEGFVSDMFVAFINLDSTRFKKDLHDAFNKQINSLGMAKRVFDSYGSIVFPMHLKKAEVHALANHLGNNITFPNFKELEQRASTWLSAADAVKFSGLTPQQKAVVNAVIALRNHIAHRSQRSLDAMNDVLSLDVLHLTGIRRQANRFHNVGAWLKATPQGRTETRFETILRILGEVAATF